MYIYMCSNDYLLSFLVLGELVIMLVAQIVMDSFPVT